MAINYIDRGSLSTAAPLLVDDLKMTPEQLGWLLSAFFWTYAVLQVAAGWLVELPQAASAPANATARVAIQIRRYIELFLLLSDYASLVAILPLCMCILPPGLHVWDENSMRGSASCETRPLQR